MLAEPYLIDDLQRGSLDQFLTWLVLHCETLICVVDGTVIGIAGFWNVVAGRSAELLGWINPEWRGGSFEKQRIIKEFLDDDVLNYAWETLGVARLQAECAVENESAQNFLGNAGFYEVGRFRMDLAFFGQLHDSVVFERINPAFEIEPIEEIVHGRRESAESTAAEPIFSPGDDVEDSADNDPPIADGADSTPSTFTSAIGRPGFGAGATAGFSWLKR